ncbi:hypothetical protein [Ruegeria sp. 6PALISEP08]|nr:hypothetical protein [Ruegeria sp. 6PALISEP08]
MIVQVEERKSYFMPDGAPRQIEFFLTSKSYGPDAQGLTGLIGGIL